MEHTYKWLEQYWGLTKEEISSLKPATRLREDLNFDEVALEELFHYLEAQCKKKVSDGEVFGKSQTFESVAALFSEVFPFFFKIPQTNNIFVGHKRDKDSFLIPRARYYKYITNTC